MHLLKEFGQVKYYVRLQERDYRGPVPEGANDQTSEASFLEDWKDIFHVGVLEVGVLTEGGEKVGEAMLTTHRKTGRMRFFEDDSPAIEIEEDHRHRGLATALVETLPRLTGLTLADPLHFTEDGAAWWTAITGNPT